MDINNKSYFIFRNGTAVVASRPTEEEAEQLCLEFSLAEPDAEYAVELIEATS